MQREIEDYARGHGLDFFPTIFEYIDADQLNAIAAKGGFPVRYPHWRFGMEYEQLSKGITTGLQKIYEMVINNDPCYAYLMTNNGTTDQKLVMAHVYGHCDFFKNNFWFSKTSRKMMDEMANHGNRVRRYMDEVGVEEVEEFIDACLSLEDLIDIHSPFIRRRDEKSRYDFGERRRKRRTGSARRDSGPRITWIRSSIRAIRWPRRPRSWKTTSAANRSRFPSGRSAMCCCFCWSTPRSSAGRPTCCRSFATRRTTSPRRRRPRS